MSRRVLVVALQPSPPSGPIYGQVSDPVDFMKSQQYAHEHVDKVTRDALMNGAAAAAVYGFDFTIGSGLSLSIAVGEVFGTDGTLYDTVPAQANVVSFAANSGPNPRIDLLVAVIAKDVDALPANKYFTQLRNEGEILAGTVYPWEQFNVNTERLNQVTLSVKQGTPASSPVAPAAGANEVPLFQVRVNAGATSLAPDKVTDVRNKFKSLSSVATDLAAHIAAADPHPQYLTQAEGDGRYSLLGHTHADATTSVSGFMSGADKTKLGHLPDMTLADFDTRYVNATGDTMGAALHVIYGGPTDAFPAGSAVGLRASINGAAGTAPIAVFGYAQAGLGNGDVAYGGFFTSHADRALAASGTTSYGVYGATEGGDTRWAGYFNGNVHVVGNFSKGGGSFLIDHPLDPNNKDLRHGFVESNCYGLVYWKSVVLEDGAAQVDLDALLGFSRGTCAALWRNIMVVAIRHQSGAHVNDNISLGIGMDVGAMFLNLESEVEGDIAEVRFLICAERRDPYILQAPFVDGSGNFVPEANKPGLTAEDEALLDPLDVEVPTGNPLIGQTVSMTVPPLIGKQGFPYHPQVVDGGVAPTREVSYIEST